MEETIVEVGLLLEEEPNVYEKILEDVGAVNVYNCETHDLYWTNKKYAELEKMTENQIKNACVRFRIVNGVGGTKWDGDYSVSMRFENFNVYDAAGDDRFDCDMDEFKQIQAELEGAGWYLIFDTFKRDYQYKIDDMKSMIQIQDIDNVGLVLYYDNPDYYRVEDVDTQRAMLIDELNGYGFAFKKEDLGIDKLRTLLTGKSCFSNNQNG